MVALVTGVGGDIGKEIAKELGKSMAIGFSYCGSDGGKIENELKELGIYAKGFAADFRQKDSGRALVKQALAHFSRVDVLVNNSGISATEMFCDTTSQAWQEVFDVNVRSAYECSQEVLSDMIAKKSGAIVNVSSIWGIVGASMEVAYSSSKSALIGFTRALAKEVAISGIRVNCVAPGFIETRMNEHLSDEEKGALIDEIPMGRAGSASEIAKIVAFFASNDSSYITGQVICADGGLL